RPAPFLREVALRAQNQNRFLAAGYVLVEPTFRDRTINPISDEALHDCVAIVEYVKRLAGVDPESVVIWGNSGGGSLALELAGETDLCAAAAEEPASVLLTGMFAPENLHGSPPYDGPSGMHIQLEPL